MDKLVFQNVPVVEFASNFFSNCPVILQFEEIPLIQVVRLENVGFTTEIPIYHPDGTYLAKVVGSRIVKTEAGSKAGLELLHPDGLTVCKLNGETLFEIRRKDAAAIKTEAELYTPTGYFVKYAGEKPSLINATGESLMIGRSSFIGNYFDSCRVGVWVRANGGVDLGCS